MPSKAIPLRPKGSSNQSCFSSSSTSQTTPKIHHHHHQSLLLLLDQCTTLHHLLQIHATITTSGLHTHPFLTGKLVETLAIKLHHHPNSLPHAMLLFSHSHHPLNPFTWNTLIRGHSLSATPHGALLLFAAMLRPPFPAKPDTFSFAFALKACARCHAHTTAKGIHGLTVVTGNHSSAHVANTQLHAYASCGDVNTARKLFDALPSPDTIAWNAMMAGYVQNGVPSEALKLLHRMRSEGVRPTEVTVVTALLACAQLKVLHLGRQIHGRVRKTTMQFGNEVNLGTSIIDMYAKCGSLELAKQVFDEMPEKDTGVWNALIAGYVYNGFFSEALRSFQDLRVSGLSPDEPTLVSTLQACAHLGMLDIGKSIHLYVEEKYTHFNAALGTALMDMYSKCGCIEKSQLVFNRMSEKDVMAWTSMINGLAVHGHAGDALELFSSMQKYGPKPDGVTFVGVLCACSHAGMVKEGMRYFQSMKREYGITPRVEHLGCMIDLFSRAGRLKEALELIGSMGMQANAVIWRSLLSACRLNLDVELAEIAVENLLKLRSDHCGDYVLLSNVYASKGSWVEARRVRKRMEERRIMKKPGFSLIESNNQSVEGKPLHLES